MATEARNASFLSSEPDIRLVLDLRGIIQEASSSSTLPEQDFEGWIGRPWGETVADPGDSKIARMLDDARTAGVSAFRQVNQRLPNGLEVPIEYTTVRQGRSGLIAVGKSLQAVAELQSQLIDAQLAIERDHWRLREVETRCRLLFDSSNEAVVLVRAEDLRIVQANQAATRALGLITSPSGDVTGREFPSEIAPEERVAFEAMLHRVRDQGKAPGILVHLRIGEKPWFVRASPLTSQGGLEFLLQLTPAAPESPEEQVEPGSLIALIERAPDGFVAIDSSGVIRRANRAFLDLVQVGHETTVVGERLSRWLGRPGADVPMLLSNIDRHGVVRLFSTSLHSELGADTDVEIGAAGDRETNPSAIGVLIRNVSSRLPASGSPGPLGAGAGPLENRIGKTSLRELVRETVDVVERQYIEAALELSGGNRTAAAQMLGVSRQSLYAKLGRYDLEPGPPTASSEGE